MVEGFHCSRSPQEIKLLSREVINLYSDSNFIHKYFCLLLILFPYDNSPGGLGEAVCGALSEETGVKVRRLAVTGIPRSGPGSVLLDLYGVSSKQVIAAVKDLLK